MTDNTATSEEIVALSLAKEACRVEAEALRAKLKASGDLGFMLVARISDDTAALFQGIRVVVAPAAGGVVAGRQGVCTGAAADSLSVMVSFAEGPLPVRADMLYPRGSFLKDDEVWQAITTGPAIPYSAAELDEHFRAMARDLVALVPCSLVRDDMARHLADARAVISAGFGTRG